MTDIYDQHRKAFPQVSAYVVCCGTDGGTEQSERIATVAFKFPADGAGRLYCYLHVVGLPMVRSYAGGGGYDKASAAVEGCAKKLAAELRKLTDSDREHYADTISHAERIARLIGSDEGYGWQRRIEGSSPKTAQYAGYYQVWKAV